MAHPEITLIEDVRRGYGFADGPAQRSLVRLRERFFQHIQPALFTCAAFRREEDPEVLILRGNKDPKTGLAEVVEYPETADTRRLRKQVQRINVFLRDAPIILLTDHPVWADDGQPIDPLRRTVRRIFNNASWQQGGRLYGGFWETMRREDRFRLLRIGTRSYPEGEPIANVDHGQLFPRLAYLQTGQAPPDLDLYDINGDGLTGTAGSSCSMRCS